LLGVIYININGHHGVLLLHTEVTCCELQRLLFELHPLDTSWNYVNDYIKVLKFTFSVCCLYLHLFKNTFLSVEVL